MNLLASSTAAKSGLVFARAVVCCRVRLGGQMANALDVPAWTCVGRALLNILYWFRVSG